MIHIGGVAKAISLEMLAEEGMNETVVDAVRRLTKMPGQSYNEYQESVLGSVHAMVVKMEDLRTNSDLRRLKSKTITDKDVARVAKYMQFLCNYTSQIR